MEKGDEINVVDKKKSLSNSSDFVTHYHGRNNLDHPFLGGDDGGGGGGGNYEVYRHGYGGAIFTPNSYSSIPYRPQGGMLGFPFTATQLKELDRQAMIYKYMLSSLPVPIHLLPQLDTSLSSIYSGRYSKNGDPEPGRCKRTDGKKWRCSKEVAPQQKYCERHLHRGRPRSRKPVEAKQQINHKKTRPTVEESKSAAANSPDPLLLLNAKTDLTISTPPPPPYYSIREGKIVSSEEQPWEDFMKSNCYIPEEYVEKQPQPLDVFSVNDGDLSPSLNLSMGNFVDHKSKSESMWLNPVSWEPFLGPLGEALQPSNPASPYNSMSTPATTVSSPSGVLHWTLFSHSDSSVCNSPTFVAAPPSEGSNQWHN